MKSQQTKRRFYNKWLYKVTVYVANAHMFRRNNAQFIANSATVKKDTRDLALQLINLKDHQLRIENKFIDIYLNDQEDYVKLITLFSEDIKHSFFPHPNLLSSPPNAKTIMVKKLPYDRYRYKVFLKPHTIISVEEKRDYLKWLESQDSRVYISDSTKDWFIKTSWNWDRRYIYVEDEKTLLLLKMRHSQALGSVHPYEISINT